MAANTFGELLRLTSFGESHGVALGAVIDGCPAGIELCEEDFLPELARRRPGQSAVTTARDERDLPRLLSGVFEGRTTGMPIAVLVDNEDARSGDYDKLREVHRPGHADETWAGKYGHRDHRGGGRSSGRETLSRVLGGVVGRKILPASTRVVAGARRIGPHEARVFDPDVIERNAVRCPDPEVAAEMEAYVLALREAGESVGGLVEIRVENPPAGLGEPVFDKLKARLAHGVMSVGAVMGFAYGAGFEAPTATGQAFVARRENFGGILGGVSTGETLQLFATVKPTSSVADVAKRGRHDPCIVPRIVPVLEAMVALVLADNLLLQRAQGPG